VTLLLRLKVETRCAHDRIEQALDLDARTSTIGAYRSLVQRLYGFHAAWEAEAAEILPDPGWLEGRARTPLLARDLFALGCCEDAVARLPLCRPILRHAEFAEALGAMYVVEGSTLGGAVIARHVQRRLGLDPGNGCAFFASYGRSIGALWNAFRERLSAHSPPGADDRIVAAAERTFERMRIWLTEEAAA
jgi:heme oxygenase (biliverdin-IX-beta and delta-forming)